MYVNTCLSSLQKKYINILYQQGIISREYSLSFSSAQTNSCRRDSALSGPDDVTVAVGRPAHFRCLVGYEHVSWDTFLPGGGHVTTRLIPGVSRINRTHRWMQLEIPRTVDGLQGARYTCKSGQRVSCATLTLVCTYGKQPRHLIHQLWMLTKYLVLIKHFKVIILYFLYNDLMLCYSRCFLE